MSIDLTSTVQALAVIKSEILPINDRVTDMSTEPNVIEVLELLGDINLLLTRIQVRLGSIQDALNTP